MAETTSRERIKARGPFRNQHYDVLPLYHQYLKRMHSEKNLEYNFITNRSGMI
jgi:hypothetical protein